MRIALKCWPDSWDAIASGRKRAEVRSIEDRTFSVGDVLELLRWDPGAGRPASPGVGIITAKITHIDLVAGDVNILGVRLSSPAVRGTLVRMAVLSLEVLDVIA